MDFHPGGVDELMRGVGKDGTQLFDEVCTCTGTMHLQFTHCIVFTSSLVAIPFQLTTADSTVGIKSVKFRDRQTQDHSRDRFNWRL